MATFRVEKTNDFTIMSNHHLRNKTLSLKAKGLLSQMLSLPDDWDYTLKGLSLINRESIDAIRTAIWELEKAGYITRRQGRDEKGKMTAIEYTIYETPQPVLENPTSVEPASENPVLENPTSDNPTSGNPTSGNPTQSNTNILNTKKSSTNEPSTNGSNTFSYTKKDNKDRDIPFRRFPTTGKGTEANPPVEQDSVTVAAEQVKSGIDYDQLVAERSDDRERLDEIVEIIAETVSTSRKTVRIASDDYPAELVKKKFRRLDRKHISFVLDNLRRNTTDIRDVRQYIKAALFNAPSTIGLASGNPSGIAGYEDADAFFEAALRAGFEDCRQNCAGDSS